MTLLRSSLGAMERVLDDIGAHGTQEASVDEMLTRQRLYELVDYEAYNAFDTGIFNFEVPEFRHLEIEDSGIERVVGFVVHQFVETLSGEHLIHGRLLGTVGSDVVQDSLHGPEGAAQQGHRVDDYIRI